MKKLLIILFLVGLATTSSQAQSYTLAACMAKVLGNNSDVKTAQLQAELAQNVLLQNKRNMMPTMGLGIEQSGNFGRSIDRFTNSYIAQFYNSTYSGLQFNMPLFNSLQNRNDLLAGGKAVEAALQGLENAKIQLKLSTLAAYMAVLGNKELLKIAINQFDNIKAQKLRIEQLLAAGLVSKIEDLQIENQLKTDEMGVSEAEMNFETSKVLLFQLMNMPYNAEAIFEDINRVEVVDSQPVNLSKSIEDMPEIKQLQLIHISQKYGIKSLKTNALPSVRLTGGYGLFYASSNKDRNFAEQLNDTRNGSLSLSFNIPIMRNLIVRPRVQNLQIQQMLTENNIEKSKTQIRQQIETAQVAFRAAQKRWILANEQENLAKQTMQFVKQQIDNGTIKMVDFLLAQSNYEKAAANGIQAKYRLLLQEKYLHFYKTGNIELE
jgi:outer membrane protein